jgi:hypothetical protein
MCLIIDANVAANIVNHGNHQDWISIRKWLTNPQRKSRLVIGGRLADELRAVAGMRRIIIELSRAGRVVEVDRVAMSQLEAVFAPSCSSDDPHILAVAVLSGARLLCTNDSALISDFKNREFVPSPKGRVYRSFRNRGLLYSVTHCGQCSE